MSTYFLLKLQQVKTAISYIILLVIQIRVTKLLFVTQTSPLIVFVLTGVTHI